LFALVKNVSHSIGRHPLTLLGSQSAHGQLRWLPTPVVRSVEVDIFVPSDAGFADQIEEQFGPGSPYHAEHGVYADPLGIGIVSLPPGWQDRLVEVRDDAGAVAFLALELHDTAVSKMMAGRDKDLEFPTELLLGGILDLPRLLARALTMRDTHSKGSLQPLLQRLRDHLSGRKLRDLLPPFDSAIREAGTQ
jgi:hypothetical protein